MVPRFYRDDAEVGRVTRYLADIGHRILQVFRMADDDEGHIADLLQLFNPPRGAHVLDVGSGTGEVARLMAIQRPDLSFTLLNISAEQLMMSPKGMTRVHAGMNAVPLAGPFDAAMYCYSLGHGNLAETLGEAARLVRPGGVLFIYDMVSGDGAPALREQLDYRVYPSGLLISVALASGFDLVGVAEPECSSAAFTGLLSEDVATLILAEVRPIAARFQRRGVVAQGCDGADGGA